MGTLFSYLQIYWADYGLYDLIADWSTKSNTTWLIAVGTFVLICTYIEQIQNCACYGLYDLVAVCKVILTINST